MLDDYNTNAHLDMQNASIVDRSFITANQTAASFVVGNGTTAPKLWDNSGWKRPEFKPDLFSIQPNTNMFNIYPGTEHWIGDPFPSHYDQDWFKPLPLWPTIQPIIFPYTPPTYSSITVNMNVQPAWKQTVEANSITVRLDVPGVRTEDANVQIENGWVQFNGKRHDTGLFTTATHYIGHDYDPQTASAVVDAGVLTVKIEKSKFKRAHKVEVTAR